MGKKYNVFKSGDTVTFMKRGKNYRKTYIVDYVDYNSGKVWLVEGTYISIENCVLVKPAESPVKEFKKGDEVFWLYNGVKKYRVVSHMDRDMVFFTNGNSMDIDEVFHSVNTFKVGQKVMARHDRTMILTIVAIDGEEFWVKYNGKNATYNINGVVKIPPYTPKIGDKIGTYRIASIDGTSVWLIDDSCTLLSRNSIKTIFEVIEMYNKIEGIV